MSVGISISFGVGNIETKQKRKKGKSYVAFPESYCVVDIETTGFSSKYDGILELSAIKVKNREVISKFSVLTNPEHYSFDINGQPLYVDAFITELTGITNNMVKDAPTFQDVCGDFLDFIGNDIIVGHNVNFDINFIYDKLLESGLEPLKNDYCDMLKMSKLSLRELGNHKLQTIAEFFGLNTDNAHRGLTDCFTTYSCFEKLREYVFSNEIDLSAYTPKGIDLRKLTTDKTDFDINNPFYDRVFVFTGKLDNMERSKAAQIVIDFGGHCENNVTVKTNYLVLGNNDYCKAIKDGKSNKLKKAESLILKGQDLKIIPEDIFLGFVNTSINA